jgi:hypothetical protein
MSDHKNSGKGFLREKLGGYQVDPPASVWNTISSRMGGRKRKGTVIMFLAAAASVALAVTLGINYFGRDLPRDGETAQSGDLPREVTSQPVQPAPERETLEEKVVRTLETVAVENGETTAPLLAEQVSQEEEFPLETGTPAISEAMIPDQDEGINETELAMDVEKEILTDQTGQAADVRGDIMEPRDEVQEAEQDPVSEEAAMDYEEIGGRGSRWILGAALSPLYTFRDAEQQTGAASSEHESGMVSYAGGIRVGYRTTRRLAIESGIFYNKMGISIGAPGIQVFSQEFDFAPLGGETERSSIMAISNSVGNIVSKSGDIYVNNYKLNASVNSSGITDQFAGEVIADQGISQHLDYLEVPFNLRYTLVDRSLKVQLVGGMSTNLLVNNYVTMETADGPSEIGYLTNIRNVNYSGNAGIGLAYHFLEHFSLSLEPRFRYFLNSINDNTLPSTRPYTFGLYTGLSYIF